jgi:hypothetical protein
MTLLVVGWLVLVPTLLVIQMRFYDAHQRP